MNLLLCAAYVAIIGIVSNPLGNLLPRKWFDPEKFPYCVFSWEQDGRIYEKIHIRAWKDLLPDMSKINSDMVRKEVGPRPTAAHLDRLAREACVAEFVHWLLIILSLAVLKIWKGLGGWICYGLCILGNLPFIIIQRYNRPRLVRTMHRLKSRAT